MLLASMDEMFNSDAILPSDIDYSSELDTDSSNDDEEGTWLADDSPAAKLKRRLVANRVTTTEQITAVSEGRENRILSRSWIYDQQVWFQRHCDSLAWSETGMYE